MDTVKREGTSILAARMAEIEPFHVMDVQNRAHELEASGRRIVHMEIGQPDFPAPPMVAEAAIEAIRTRRLGYTDSTGIPQLRRAISDYYRERFGLAVPPSRIVITAGASGAFLLAFGALVGPADEVLMPDPCYPCNRHFVRLFEGRPRQIPVDERSRYQLTAADVRSSWSRATRGVLLASPSNPTGTSIPRDEMRAIIETARELGGFVVVDEIYQGLVYDVKASTALEFSDDVFVVNSFSKYFCMTGWRLGWIVAPESHVREIEKLAQNAFICPSAPAQYAALAAFRPETLAVLEQRRGEFQRRRDYMVPALRSLGFRIPLMPAARRSPQIAGVSRCECSTRRALRSRRGSISARTAPAGTCASPTRARWTTSRKAWRASRGCCRRGRSDRTVR
jgi:aspartate/methionine/tyrosine aminotransferase